MARSVVSGPFIATGNLNPVQVQDSDVGPSLFFQGQGMPDPRLVGTVDAAPGRYMPAFAQGTHLMALDYVPSTGATIFTQASSAVVPVGGSLLLVPTITQSLGLSLAIPVDVFPPGPLDPVVAATVTIDAGFTSGSITAGAKTLTIPAGAWRYFRKGMAIGIAGGGASASLPLLTFVSVAPLPGATTLTVNDAAGTTVTSLAVFSIEPDLVGQSNFYTTTGAWPAVPAGGAINVWDPAQLGSRTLKVVNNNVGDTGYSLTVRGWDMYGVPMTETIAVTANGTTHGKKAWKYLSTFTLLKSGGGTTAGTIVVSYEDSVGLPIAIDQFEGCLVFWNGILQSVSSGVLVADRTFPATATTGDVRGTMQLGVGGANTGFTTSPNGTIRFTVFQNMPLENNLYTNNLSQQVMFGASQFAG
jgi:hypothetical protein